MPVLPHQNDAAIMPYRPISATPSSQIDSPISAAKLMSGLAACLIGECRVHSVPYRHSQLAPYQMYAAGAFGEVFTNFG